MYVEISKCPPIGYTDEISGKHIPLNNLRVYQIGGGSPSNRTRIGKDKGGSFKFEVINTDKVSRIINHSLNEAEQWWSSYPNWW